MPLKLFSSWKTIIISSMRDTTATRSSRFSVSTIHFSSQNVNCVHTVHIRINDRSLIMSTNWGWQGKLDLVVPDSKIQHTGYSLNRISTGHSNSKTKSHLNNGPTNHSTNNAKKQRAECSIWRNNESPWQTTSTTLSIHWATSLFDLDICWAFSLSQS